jgi:hypothetical protein
VVAQAADSDIIAACTVARRRAVRMTRPRDASILPVRVSLPKADWSGYAKALPGHPVLASPHHAERGRTWRPLNARASTSPTGGRRYAGRKGTNER